MGGLSVTDSSPTSVATHDERGSVSLILHLFFLFSIFSNVGLVGLTPNLNGSNMNGVAQLKLVCHPRHENPSINFFLSSLCFASYLRNSVNCISCVKL